MLEESSCQANLCVDQRVARPGDKGFECTGSKALIRACCVAGTAGQLSRGLALGSVVRARDTIGTPCGVGKPVQA
jgi:hypothetical protein